jgi:hypothetical protein
LMDYKQKTNKINDQSMLRLWQMINPSHDMINAFQDI